MIRVLHLAPGNRIQNGEMSQRMTVLQLNIILSTYNKNIYEDNLKNSGIQDKIL
jgi:hypothetical protein